MCAPIPENKWSWKYECCVKCGTQSKKGRHIHKGKGLCLSCWDKKRGKNPKRKAYTKVNHDKWYKKVKGTEKHRLQMNKNQKEWNENHKNHYRAIYFRCNMRTRFRKFILGKLRKDRNTIGGLKYYCEGCKKQIETPIKSKMNVIGRDLKIFKEEHNKIIHSNDN